MNLEALEALARAATPGPWATQDKNIYLGVRVWSSIDKEGYWSGWDSAGTIYNEGGHSESDAAYIAACSPERILALVAVAKAAGDVGVYPGQVDGIHELRDAL